MSVKKPAELSPESMARANRKRLAAEEGARAMADFGRQAIEVRKNMARLRELRETKETVAGTRRAPLPVSAPKKRTRKLPR
ncbi:transcriptional regulator [Bradyrhizobium sp. WSM 1704]|uniref:transcriptional regulator n=1 Tax=Bradyrhizobium semiaridum TaxID=2821404 RepID=UPI001CE2A0D3|nr:transcriptional regulator [Bradyrhizobium semiaridum]MCA6124256.1 transcriptional regulator [Bradyrhizobium semiaridum]